ncbi:Transposon Tn7 transposition protein TnsD C-termianl domain-containing protein (plasmid) [Cupriavidus necator H16]|uniref:TniQ protein n=1 Tax=Cupriavidus necator (strain ATCC 17699 / DSM 428 / KCTC 22496 / NCIMB 10442 / H16 / Stanier 337) TaxID=381666 RepID=A0AAF1D5A4_CUPNH|nr:hypothetical protein [Cupriavidus necator]QCC05363.1 hypothetical protein E6A55_32680 [Cupriavidus necator H16]QQB81533.1 hypothetical protein I6H87_32670 [Cupriavidus necator]
MAAYPSVNWWPGNLRPYESRLSFVARFCALNGINVRKCAEFLRVEPDGCTPLPIDEIKRLASVLGEAAPLVEDVFSPSIRFIDVGRYGPPPDSRERRAIRYCETCMQHGYHSYLHQLGWLSRCPFHLSELKTTWAQKHTASFVSQRVGALEFVMRQRCRTWPHGIDAGFPAREQGRVASLAGWVARASVAAARMSLGEIWSSGNDGMPGAVSLDQAFAQLRTLEPPPEDIEQLLIEAGDRWTLESHVFARQAKIQLGHLRLCHLSFADVLHFYIRINAASANPSSFVTRLNAIQDRQARHGTCRCRWRLTKEGRLSRWVSVRPEEGPRWGLICPYDIALNELQLGWGRSDLALSNRPAEQERRRFCSVSHAMRDLGLIRYTRDAAVAPAGYLYADQDVWTCCEWVRESPLTAVLDMAVAWETELTFDALTTWLDDIDRGVAPLERDDSKSCVRLRETDDGLLLIKWTRAEANVRRGLSRI